MEVDMKNVSALALWAGKLYTLKKDCIIQIAY